MNEMLQISQVLNSFVHSLIYKSTQPHNYFTDTFFTMEFLVGVSRTLVNLI